MFFLSIIAKEFTSLCYGPSSTLFVGSSTGIMQTLMFAVQIVLNSFLLVSRSDFSVGHEREPVCDVLENRTQGNK